MAPAATTRSIFLTIQATNHVSARGHKQATTEAATVSASQHLGGTTLAKFILVHEMERDYPSEDKFIEYPRLVNLDMVSKILIPPTAAPEMFVELILIGERGGERDSMRIKEPYHALVAELEHADAFKR
jgi:hypothetical protein